MRNIKQCKEGDIVQHPGGNKYKVLYRTPRLVFLSESYDYDLAFYHPFTVAQLVKENWKLLTKEGKTPYGKKELEDLLGNVKIHD